jgi:hypothetical protein
MMSQSSNKPERPYHALVLPGFGLILLTICTLLYSFDGSVYQQILKVWMLHPFPHPFIDWEFMPTAAQCWAKGVDVYVNNTCYTPVPNGAFSYSPLWLRLSFLPTSAAATTTFGLLWALLFIGSLAYLPPPIGRFETGISLLTLGSSLTVFAIERGNVDLIMFLLTIAGVALILSRPALCVVGYAAFTLAGLLKFYPFVLWLLMLREPPRRFFPLVSIGTAILVVFVVMFWPELRAASKNIPIANYFTDMIAAVNLPFGLPELLSYLHDKFGVSLVPRTLMYRVPRAVFTMMVMTMLASAAWLVFFGGVRSAMQMLGSRQRALLVAGAALICGCFFAGPSVGYRAILLLLVLPGLLQLRTLLPGSGVRIVTAVLYAIVLVSWVLTIHYVLRDTGVINKDELSGITLLYWFVHELSWWLIITVLLAALSAFVVDSEMAKWALGLSRPVMARSAWRKSGHTDA